MNSVARHYVMVARSGEGDTLRFELFALAQAVRALPGCEGVETLRDVADPDRFMFVEKWQSVDAHKAASALLSKETLAPVMAVLASRPESAYLEYLGTA